MILRWLKRFAGECVEFPVTMTLCGVYGGLFVAMAIWQGGFQFGQIHGLLGFLGIQLATLIDFGAIEVERILERHEYWRLVTATLLHGSAPHVVLNGWALYQLGRIIEDWYGGSTLIFLHLILGLAGSVASLWVHRWFPMLVQVGGSGAIFGFCAFLAAAAYFDADERGKALFRALIFTLVFGFGLGYLLGADNAAHAGGAIAGGIVGCFDYVFLRERLGRRLSLAMGVFSTCVFVVAFVLDGRSFAAETARRAHAEEVRLAKRKQAWQQFLEARRQAALRNAASRQIEQIFLHAASSVGTTTPKPLEDRIQRADQLEKLAQQITDPRAKKYILDVVDQLRVASDAAYMKPEHLLRVIREIQTRRPKSDDASSVEGENKPTEEPDASQPNQR